MRGREILRLIAGIVAGIVTWAVVVTVLNLGLRYGWADYNTVEKAMTFTVPMMMARLVISAVSSVITGYVAAWFGNDRMRPPLIAGFILLLLFIPVHYSIWNRFPLWYHLTFLTSLVVLSVVGGRMRTTQRRIFQTAA